MSRPAAGKRTFLTRLYPSKSLGVRLFLVFFIATMGIVLSLGYTSYSVARQTIENNALSSNQQTVEQTAEKLDVILLSFEDSLGQLFYNRDIQAAVSQGSIPAASSAERQTQTEVINSELDRWLASVKGVQGVYLVPLNEELPVSATGTKDSVFMEGIRESSWFKQLEEKPQSLWITQGLKEGDTSGVFRLAKSMTDDSGGTGYIAVCDIGTEELESHLGQVSLGMDSYVELLTGRDELIASSRLQADSYLRLGGTLFNGLTEASGSLPTKDEKGKSILAVYGTLQSSGWRVLGVVPSENLVKDAHRILSTTYIAVAAAAVLAVLIGLWMVRMVSRPLSKLKDLMFKGAEGDLRVRTKVASSDEIGQLSASFNLMMERITELVVHTNETAREVLETADALGSASRKTAASAKDIAAATEEIAGGAGSLALEADRGSEMTAQISERMDMVISAAHEMERTAHGVGQSSREGVVKLQELLDRTHKTGGMTDNLVMKVNELKDTASSVIKVLEVMQSITQQTNILSLNASIEAARAGEAGRGFTVVAGEIRQLSEQSKRSIAMVAEITGRIMTDMHETVAALSEVAPLFGEQIASVQNTSDIFVTVQGQMNHFITRLDSVGASIDGLSQSQHVLADAINNVSSFAEQSSAASQEVASLSGEQQNVSEYLVDLSGKLEHASVMLKERLSKFSV
ncbi:methyl-accepting chemotaxis protein [Paenibacillus sp. S150]|uniref:methyl-accepting chemotaxis protein n=1 Tax=Paenibacillus sp. S150 TaxID=2749826 RepID=UPI001C59C91F|nr:methyl-accepting chemotaxis protein [Paenibacillus sp. S150]MBW4084364.1 methyl-accepting chemotaxis protein [Paenibacillus sp. S150]